MQTLDDEMGNVMVCLDFDMPKFLLIDPYVLQVLGGGSSFPFVQCLC